jgi:hypothetical protein
MQASREVESACGLLSRAWGELETLYIEEGD